MHSAYPYYFLVACSVNLALEMTRFWWEPWVPCRPLLAANDGDGAADFYLRVA